MDQGVYTVATDVDHVIDHKGDVDRFWAGPFQALCKSHHSQKTAAEMGGRGVEKFETGRGRARWVTRAKNNPNAGNSGGIGKEVGNAT
jgi:5-methylcytosine-specific restriction protein A